MTWSKVITKRSTGGRWEVGGDSLPPLVGIGLIIIAAICKRKDVSSKTQKEESYRYKLPLKKVVWGRIRPEKISQPMESIF